MIQWIDVESYGQRKGRKIDNILLNTESIQFSKYFFINNIENMIEYKAAALASALLPWFWHTSRTLTSTLYYYTNIVILVQVKCKYSHLL